MVLLNTFDPKTTEETFNRLEKLTYMSKPQWGKMNVAQMMVHLNVAYDLGYGKTKSNHSFFGKLMMKLFVNRIVMSEKPYSKNSPTGVDFIIAEERDFEKEKSIFIDYVKLTETNGANYFKGKESSSFGKLTAKEWSTQFYKHIDHHFTRYGV